MSYDNDKPIDNGIHTIEELERISLDAAALISSEELSPEEEEAMIALTGAKFLDATDAEAAFKSADIILAEMANTFRERNKIYGDNYLRVGAVMMALFPGGVTLKTTEDFNRWHLFELQIVKLTRFANSGLMHADSIHDCSVYGAMVESLIDEFAEPIGGAA